MIRYAQRQINSVTNSIFFMIFYRLSGVFHYICTVVRHFVIKTAHAEIAQSVEHQLPKLRVASSNLVFRSWFSKSYDLFRDSFFFLRTQFAHKSALRFWMELDWVSGNRRGKNCCCSCSPPPVRSRSRRRTTPFSFGSGLAKLEKDIRKVFRRKPARSDGTDLADLHFQRYLCEQ